MEKNKLTINLVTWNGEKYLSFLFESLAKQTNKSWDLIIVDNGSSDHTIAEIERLLPTLGVSYKFIKNSHNKGFAGGHNQAVKESDSEFFLIINQDLYLASDCVAKMLKFLESHTEVVAVAPRTMKWDFANQKFTNLVDSLGLRVFRNRRVVEIGEGCEYDDVGVRNQLVWGVSGAIAMFRRDIVDEFGYFLDENLNSYKEDVDLSYRINLIGRKIFVLHDAVAYHDRTGFGSKHKDDLASIRNKVKQNPLVRYFSYRNHLAVLYKNELWQNFALDFPWILWYEIKKFVYFLLCDRSVLRGLGNLWKDRRVWKLKRQQTIQNRRIDWRRIREKMFYE